MSVKYIQFNADRTSFEPKTFASVEDLLHPLNNNVWFKVSGPGMAKVSQIETIIKALWTKENIKANYKWFFPSLAHANTQYPGDPASYEKLIEWIPDDLVWALFHSAIRIGRSGITVNYPLRKLYSAHELSTTVVAFNCDVDDAPQMSLPLSDTDKAKILTILQRNTREYQDAFTAHANKRLSPDYNIAQEANCFYPLLLMVQGKKYLHDVTGENTYTAAEFGAHVSSLGNIKFSWGGIRSGNLPRFLVKVSASHRTPIERVLSYSTNVMDLLDYPVLAKNEHNPVLYGVELEVSTNYPPRDLVWANDIPFLICKSDGSVTGSKNYPVELVTVPASFKAHKIQWAKFFNKLDYEGFDCTKNTNNGMHVHIGVDSFNGSSHIRRMTFFINNPANFEFFFKVSERTKSNIDSFCQYGSPVKNRGNTIAKSVDIAKRIRGAVNFGKGTTVEIRIFKGIVSYATIIKNLEIVDSLFYFSKDCSLADMNLGAYIRWINATAPNKYIVLKKYLSSITTLDKMIKASEVHDIVFLERDPPKMLKAIEKHNYKMDNDHLTALNRMKGVRTFVLDKDSGKVGLVQPTGIDSMNTELTNRYASL